jgi:hypothetical protein
MYQLVCVTFPNAIAPRERNTQPKPAGELRRASPGFRNGESHWQRVMHFGDQVIAEDNNRDIVTK